MNLDDISEKMAKDSELSVHQIKQINRVQWKFLADVMREGDFKPVKIMYLGKFHRNKRKFKDQDDNKTIGGDSRGVEKSDI